MLTTFGVVIFAGALVFAAGSDEPYLSDGAIGLTSAVLILMILTSYPRLAPFLYKGGQNS